MCKHNDLTGKQFGRLTVVREADRAKDRHIRWLCKCECGNEVTVSSNGLMSGKTKSCGCYQRDRTSESHRTHGARGNHKNTDRLYNIWNSMRKRCYTKTCKDYKDYGGRGITICDEWNDFAKFKEWALQNGYSYTAEFGKCTIDRIDVNGNYCPDNCRWVGMDIQNSNKRSSRKEDGGKHDAERND